MDNVHCESCNIVIAYIIMPEAYSEPYHRSKMECFAKIVKTKNLITIFKKDAICYRVLNTFLSIEVYFFTNFYLF